MAPGEEDPAALSGVDYPVAAEAPSPRNPVTEDSGLIGREIGTYRLLSLLGGTGMSRVLPGRAGGR